jgi:hypothetical protein
MLRQVLERVDTIEDTLNALAILCQGYLAVHAAAESSSDSLKPALERMGWPLPEGDPAARLLRQDLAAQRPTVRSSAWWREPFAESSSPPLTEAVQGEWQESLHGPLPPPVEQLVACIVEGREVATPQLVADCYVALASRLGAAP